MLSDGSISRTVQYKKVTKPLLERKRRARINRCLDELKELMVEALEAEGENISKLEKADILELTVRHLHRLHKRRDPIEDAQRFQEGFGKCATEACQYLLSLPGTDARLGENLIRHLGSSSASVLPLSIQVPNHIRTTFSPPLSPMTPNFPLNKSYQEVLSSTPSVQDLAKPFTGLLMQVPKKGVSARGVLRHVILQRQSQARMQQQQFVRIEPKRDPRQDESDSDIEIDIERVDSKDMWRPW